MDINITLEQFNDIMKDIFIKSDGSTNKKCPICGNDVIIERHGCSSTLRCKSDICFSIGIRGI